MRRLKKQKYSSDSSAEDEIASKLRLVKLKDTIETKKLFLESVLLEASKTNLSIRCVLNIIDSVVDDVALKSHSTNFYEHLILYELEIQYTKQAEETAKQAEERAKQAEERAKQAEEVEQFRSLQPNTSKWIYEKSVEKFPGFFLPCTGLSDKYRSAARAIKEFSSLRFCNRTGAQLVVAAWNKDGEGFDFHGKSAVVVITGRSGVGKTTLALSTPWCPDFQVPLSDIRSGFLDREKLYVQAQSTWAMTLEAYPEILTATNCYIIIDEMNSLVTSILNGEYDSFKGEKRRERWVNFLTTNVERILMHGNKVIFCGTLICEEIAATSSVANAYASNVRTIAIHLSVLPERETIKALKLTKWDSNFTLMDKLLEVYDMLPTLFDERLKIFVETYLNTVEAEPTIKAKEKMIVRLLHELTCGSTRNLIALVNLLCNKNVVNSEFVDKAKDNIESLEKSDPNFKQNLKLLGKIMFGVLRSDEYCPFSLLARLGVECTRSEQPVELVHLYPTQLRDYYSPSNNEEENIFENLRLLHYKLTVGTGPVQFILRQLVREAILEKLGAPAQSYVTSLPSLWPGVEGIRTGVFFTPAEVAMIRSFAFGLHRLTMNNRLEMKLDCLSPICKVLASYVGDATAVEVIYSARGKNVTRLLNAEEIADCQATTIFDLDKVVPGSVPFAGCDLGFRVKKLMKKGQKAFSVINTCQFHSLHEVHLRDEKTIYLIVPAPQSATYDLAVYRPNGKMLALQIKAGTDHLRSPQDLEEEVIKCRTSSTPDVDVLFLCDCDTTDHEDLLNKCRFPYTKKVFFKKCIEMVPVDEFVSDCLSVY